MNPFFILIFSAAAYASCLSYLEDDFQSDPSLMTLISLSGRSLSDPGKYQKCIDQDHTAYALISVKAYESKAYLGLCLPSSCSEKDIKSGIKSLISKYDKEKILKKDSVEVIKSEKYNKRSFSIGFYLAVTVFVLYLSLVTYGSILHQRKKNDENVQLSGLQLIFTEFAVETNFKKVFETTDSPDTLLFFSGLRFYFANLIVFYHLMSMTFKGPFINVNQAIDYSQDFSHKFLTIVTYYVDGFFVFSGIFLAFTLVPEVQRKQGKFSWSWFIVKRFLRYSPVYFTVITFYFFIFSYLGSGPIWPLNSKILGNCENWFWNYLYIQNFTNGDEYNCMTYTWYIAAEFQFYVISPLFILLYLKNKNWGYLSMFSALLGSCIYSGIISKNNDFTPTYRHGYGSEKQSVLLNFNPPARISTFLVGISIGLLYRKFKDSKSSLISDGKKTKRISEQFEEICLNLISTPKIRHFFYVIGLALMALVNFLPHDLDKNGEDNWSQDTKVTFLVFYRFLFAVGLGFCLLPLMMGHGSQVRFFLSMKFFQVFGRISYSLYVSHMLVLVFFIYNRSSSMVIDNYYIVLCGLSMMVVANIIALLLSSLVELPFITIERKYLRN